MEATPQGFSYGGFRLRLVDEGDIGDLYNFCPTSERPPAEATYTRRGEQAVANFHGSEVTVTADELPDGSLQVYGEIENGQVDHRIRLHIALDEVATGSVALAPFEVVERPLRSEGGTETASPTWPARGAVLAGDVAVLEHGVFEYEVIEDPPEIAITLLRAVGTISRPEIATRGWAAGPDIATPDAQVLGDQPFVIWLKRGLRPAELPAAWERVVLAGYVGEAKGGGDLPNQGSLLEIEGAELSSIRKVDGHIEVRIWNPTQQSREARVGDRTIRLGPARIETIRLD